MGMHKGFKKSCNLEEKKYLCYMWVFGGRLVLIYLLHILFSYFQNELVLSLITSMCVLFFTYVLSHANTPKHGVEKNEQRTCISS